MILLNGTRVRDRYLIDSLVGQGGMGAVYRATDLHLGHSVAIKENLLQTVGNEDVSDSSGTTGSRRNQFEREAQILARLKHPGLPKVTDHFVIPDQGQYLVMEFVEGEDLSTRIKRTGPMTELEAVALIRRVCGILAYLHSQKPPIIHRDIKPANIRQTPEGDIVVVDFGVAKIFSSEATVTAARAVTPGFSPLEQYGGSQSTDERSDIYALGATLHQLVTGKRPPEATSRITQTGGKGLGWLELPGVSDLLASVIRKAVELRPEDRYPKIGDFARALEEVESASSETETRPMPGMAQGYELSPTAPLGTVVPPDPTFPAAIPAPPPPTAPPTFAPPPPVPAVQATVAPPTAVPQTAVPPAAVPPAAPPPMAAPAAAPVAPAPAAPAPSPSMVGTPAYGPPPVEKRPNRLPLFIGIGVLAVVLAGGGYMLFGRGSAPKVKAPGEDLVASGTSSTQSSYRPTPVDDRDNTSSLPPTTAGGSEPPAPSGGGTAPTSGGNSERPGAGSSPQSPASTPATPDRPASGSVTPPSSSGSSAAPAPAPPKPSTTDPRLVPLTDNPGQPPVSASQGNAGGAGTVPQPASVPVPPIPAPQTPPQVVPPTPGSTTTGTVTPGTSTTGSSTTGTPAAPPTPAVVPAPVLGDTLVIDPTGAGSHGSLSDAIQAWKEAYEKDRRVRTLLLKPGTYPRSTTLFMGNAGRLIGSGPPGSVVISYSGSNPGLSLEGVDIIVKNVTVRSNGKSALSATKGQARIENCEFTSNGSHAVQLNGATASVTFTRCRMFTSAGRGLMLANGTARLDNCDVTGNQLGIEVASGSLTMTGGSIKENQGTGLRTRGTGRADLSNVTISGNLRHGVIVEGGSITLNGCTVTGNNQAGVFCAGGGRVTISGGDFTRNLTGAIVDSCGAITRSGSIREK